MSWAQDFIMWLWGLLLGDGPRETCRWDPPIPDGWRVIDCTALYNHSLKQSLQIVWHDQGIINVTEYACAANMIIKEAPAVLFIIIFLLYKICVMLRGPMPLLLPPPINNVPAGGSSL